MRAGRFLCLLVLCLSLGSPAWSGINEGLILHFDFEDFNGATIQDRSGNSNDGLVYNVVPISGTPSGNGYEFDGLTSYIEVPGNASLGVSNVSVTAWIRPENLNVGIFHNNTIFSTQDALGVNGGFGFAAGRVYDLSMGMRTSTGAGLSFVAENAFSEADVGQWHFVAFTYSYASGTHTVKLYLNGSLLGSYSNPGAAPAYNGQPAFIGSNYDGRAPGGALPREFVGAMADLRVYDRTLSDTEVGELHELSAILPDSDALVLHYDFEGFDGSTVPDLSGNGNHGIAFFLNSVPETPFGSGVYFDGLTSYIEVPGNSSLYMSNSTVSAWVKPENLDDTLNNAVIFSTEEFNGNRGGYAFAVGVGYSMNMAVRSSVIPGTGFNAPSVFSVSDNNRWTHIAFTHAYDGSQHTGAFYINGRLVYTETKTGPAPHYDGQVGLIGTNYEGRPRGFSFRRELMGVMADLKIYSRALTPDEIFEVSGRIGAAVIFPAVEVCWNAVVGEMYQLQAASDLTMNEWEDFGLPIEATNTFQCVLDSTRDAPNKVYRVEPVNHE